MCVSHTVALIMALQEDDLNFPMSAEGYENYTTTVRPEEVAAFLRWASKESFRHRYPVIIYLLVLIAVGLIGNTLVLTVYGLRFPPSAMRVFILAMGICDLITSAVGLPLQLVTIRFAYDTFSYWLCRGFFALTLLPTQASGVMLVLVSLDRYHKICRPLKKQLNARQAWLLTLASVAGSVILFGPFVELYGLHSVETGVRGISASMCWNDKKNLGMPYRIVVSVAFYGELLVMGMAYLLIGRQVWRQSRKRCKMSKPSGKDGNVQVESPSASSGGIHQMEPVTSVATSIKALSTDESSGCSSQSATKPPLANENNEHSTPITVITAHARSTAKNDQDRGTSPTPENLCTGVTPKADGVKSVQTTDHCGKKIWSQTTRMMALLTLLHVVNWLPHLVMRFYRKDPVNWCDNLTDCGWNFYGIVIRSFYINSAVNALVYGFCNARFRLQCHLLFRSGCCKGGQS